MTLFDQPSKITKAYNDRFHAIIREDLLIGKYTGTLLVQKNIDSYRAETPLGSMSFQCVSKLSKRSIDLEKHI